MDEHWSEEERDPGPTAQGDAAGGGFLPAFFGPFARTASARKAHHVCVVRSCEDQVMPNELEPWIPQRVDLDLRIKPFLKAPTSSLGTADAVQRGLEAHPEWEGLLCTCSMETTFRPRGSGVVASNAAGSGGFCAERLGFARGSVSVLAVFEGKPQTGVVRLIEKPSEEEVYRVADEEGEVGEHERVPAPVQSLF